MPCDGISWSTGHGKAQHRPSKIQIASPTLPPSAVGSVVWTPRPPFSSCDPLCGPSQTGWHAESISRTLPCPYPGRPCFPFFSSFGPCASEISFRPPSLPGISNPAFVACTWERSAHHGQGFGKAQTALSATGVPTTAPLDRSSRGKWLRVCGPVSFT